MSVFAYRGQADSVRFSHPGLRDDLWFAPLETRPPLVGAEPRDPGRQPPRVPARDRRPGRFTPDPRSAQPGPRSEPVRWRLGVRGGRLHHTDDRHARRPAAARVSRRPRRRERGVRSDDSNPGVPRCRRRQLRRGTASARRGARRARVLAVRIARAGARAGSPMLLQSGSFAGAGEGASRDASRCGSRSTSSSGATSTNRRPSPPRSASRAASTSRCAARTAPCARARRHRHGHPIRRAPRRPQLHQLA